MEQVALDHVLEGAGMVVIAGTAFQSQVFVEDDLDFFDVVAVPHRFQEAVGETQSEDVQHRGLAEEVVHPVDVVFRDQRGKYLVQFPGRFQPRAERLLQYQPGSRRKLVTAQEGTGFLADFRGKGEVDGNRPFQTRQQVGEPAVRRDVDLMVFRGCGHRVQY